MISDCAFSGQNMILQTERNKNVNVIIVWGIKYDIKNKNVKVIMNFGGKI